jgi:uncharacterized protein YhaN
MNYSKKIYLIFSICFGICELRSFESQVLAKDSAFYDAKNDAKTLNKATKKSIKYLQKKLSKAKKKYEKIVKQLIAKNVSKADREKNKDLAILKREIQNITNELNNLNYRN